MKRFSRRTLVLLVLSGVVLGLWVSCSTLGLTRRAVRVDARADIYAAELRTEPRRFYMYGVSPDARYVVYSHRVVTSYASYLFHAVRDTFPAWVFSDYNTVKVLDLWSGEVRPIISVRQADVGSGISHGVRWSTDGKAILVTGAGSLNSNQSETLCLVYLVAEDALIKPASCE